MRALLDVNVLIALHDALHVHHQVATDWIEQHRQHGWASCPITQNGWLRVASQPSYSNPQPLSKLLEASASILKSRVHEFWPDDISLLDGKRLHANKVLGHRQLTDVYLLALAVHHHGRLVTFDAKIPTSVVVGASAKHLVTLLAP
jgi:uncharacterized protein